MVKIPNIKIPPIKDREGLKKAIKKLKPVDCYYSVSCWLNPRKIRGKKNPYPHYKYADNLFIYADLPFDIDAHKKKPLWKAKEESEKLVKFIKKKYGKEPHYTLFSGNGYQVIYKWKPKNINIRNPMKSYQKLREKIIKEIPKRIEIDENVTRNLYGVIRLPNTMHHNGEIAQLFPF